MEVPAIVLSTLERSINRVLTHAPGGRRALQDLDGTAFELHLSDLDISVWAASNGRILRLSSVDPGNARLSISGRSADMLKAALEGRTGDEFPREVKVDGDMDTARRVQALLRALDPDWEEALAGLTGDSLARGVGELVRGGLAWGRETRSAFERNLAEYLRDELRAIPDRAEVEAFNDAVDKLRDDLERLEAQLDHFGGGDPRR